MTRYKLILRTNRVNKHGLSPIYFKLLHQGRYIWISTGITIPANFWDPVKEKINPGFDKDIYCIQKLARCNFKAADYLARVLVLDKVFSIQDFTAFVIKDHSDFLKPLPWRNTQPGTAIRTPCHSAGGNITR